MNITTTWSLFSAPPVAFSFRQYWRRNWASRAFCFALSLISRSLREANAWLSFWGALNEGSPRLTSPCVRGCVCIHVHWSGAPSSQTPKRHTHTHISGFPLGSSALTYSAEWTHFRYWRNKAVSHFSSLYISDIWAAAATGMLKHCGCFIPKGRFCVVWRWLRAERLNWRSNYCGRRVGRETSGDWKSCSQTEQKDAAAEALSLSMLPVHPGGWQETACPAVKAFSLVIRYQSKLKSCPYGIRLRFPCHFGCVLSNPASTASRFRLANLVDLTKVTSPECCTQSLQIFFFFFTVF